MTILDIERMLLNHKAVRELCVLNPQGGTRCKNLWAFVALTTSTPDVIYDFHAYCASEFAGSGVDLRIKILSALPRKPTGGVCRRELARLCSEPLSTDPMAFSSPHQGEKCPELASERSSF